MPFGQLQERRLSSEDFWTNHKADASMFIDAQSVQAVLQASTRWASVGAELKELTASFLLGRKMFEGP